MSDKITSPLEKLVKFDLDKYEADTEKRAGSSVFDPTKGLTQVENDPANALRAGERKFDPEQGFEVAGEKEMKLDTGALLLSLDYGGDKPSDDERYCAKSFLDGRISVDEIDDTIAPHMVAAVSHTLFNQKNDFDGVLIANALKFYDAANNKYADGYNKDTKRWNPKSLLTHMKTAWDIILDETGKKRRDVLNADLKAHGITPKDGMDFFSTETSQKQLDYMYNIASQRIGNMDKFFAYDNADAAKMVGGNSISLGADGWFGLKSIPKALWDEGSRAVKLGWQAATSEGPEDDLAALYENTTWHYALESSLDGEFDNSDKFIIGMVARHYGLKPDDYKGVYQKISEKQGGILRLVDSAGETQALLAVPRGLAPTHLKTNFLIDGGNEIYRKLNVVDKFKNDYYDTLGVTRLADAIGVLGSDPKAAEGVAIYTSKRKDSTDLLGFINRNEGDSDGIRNWANEYLAGATDAKDEAERFKTVQTAFYTIQGLMNHPSGVLPENKVWWSEWGAGGANIGINFCSNVWGFLSGTGAQAAYKAERWIDGAGVETKEAAEKAHREHMISQQVRNIAAWDVHNEGSIAGWLGDQIVGFKAFELIFAARFSSMLNKIPTKWARNTSKWLTESRSAKVLSKAKRIEDKSDDMLKTADEIEDAANELMKRGTIATQGDNLAFASASLEMVERAEALTVAAHKGVNRMKSLIGSQRSAQILDYWRSILDRTPGLFMIHESSIDDMERSAAGKYAEVMVENDTGYDDEMWTTAQDIIQGRAVVSTGFMMNLGEFFKKLKSNALAKGADATVAKNLAKIESEIIKAAKNPNLPESIKTIKAHILGMKVAFGEGVLRQAQSIGRLGFGIGFTNSLGEDIQDAAVGVKDWGDVGNDALVHGAEEGGAMGVTLAFMRSYKGVGQSLELGRRNVIAMKTIAQSQRPENIISSILARSKEANEMTPDAKDMTRDEGISRFEARLGEYSDIMADANETSRNANLEKWRGENRDLCGEEGAKMFDAFVRDLKYAPQVIDWRLENLGQRLTPKDLENTLNAGGLDAKAEQLEDGNVVVDVAFDFGGTRIGSKLLVHGGTIFVQDGAKFKESFALDVSKNIAEGKASKGLIEKYNALTETQKTDLEKGADINGILTDAMREMQSRGLFFNKEEAIKGKESRERNLVNIESPELYDGIVFLANGAGERASIGDVRHEVIGHAVLDALRKAGAITPQQIEALKVHFGGDAKWEERFVDATVKAIAAGDANLVKELLPEQRTAITRIRDAARGVLKAMHLIKEKRGPEANFNVDTFLHETLERANETLKLQAERKHMEDLVRANREAALEQARLEAQARRRELEKTLMEERRRNSELGHERAVRIAKSRDEMVSVEETIEKIADSAKSVEDFLSKVEKSKGEFIKKLKRLGFDKGEVGKFIEDWYLGRMDAHGDRLMERLETERVAAEAKAVADKLAAENKAWREAARKQWDATEKKLAEEEVRKAKAEYKARLDAERQRLQAKAESKKQGEKFAKELSRVVQVAEQLGLEILDRLRSATSVKQFDNSNKSALKEFDRLTKGISSDIVKPHRDNFKRELYDARKKMELKADAMKAREAENKRIEEERKAKEKEARAKQKEAERKAKEKKAEEVKKRAEEKKALESTVKEAAIRVERELKALTAKQKQEQRNSELALKGIELMAKGQPVPNKCAIAGLKGEQLERKRAFLRQSGYYYDKATDCWVNKSTAPKAFKRASTAEVGKAVNNIVNAKAIAKLKGKPEAFAEFMVGILNGVNGDVGEVSGGSDTSKKPVEKKPDAKKGKKGEKTETKPKESKVQGEAKPLTEEDKRNLEAFKIMSAMVREQAALNGWSKDVLEQKLRELAKLKLEIDPETNQIRIKGEQSSAEKPTTEANKPSEPSVPSIPENKTLREEKKWWTKQLTAEERLGLAVIEVLGKPWGVAYCAGEIIQGGENIRIAGKPLPEGAVVRPFSVAAAEKALEAMADRKVNEGVIEAEMRTKPFFNAEWKIADRKARIETMARNAKDKAEKEKAEKELAEYNAIMELESKVARLKKEKIDIDAHIVEKKKTVEELETLGLHQLASLPPEYTKKEAEGLKSNIDAQIKEIEATLAKKRMPTHADGVDKGKEIAAEVKEGGGKFSVSNIYTGSAFDYANSSRLGGVDDGPSLKKIGTGEGAYAYGWGLYGTNKRGIAKSYAKAEKYHKESLTFDKKEWDENAGDWGLNSIMYSYLWERNDIASDFVTNLERQDYFYKSTINEIKREGKTHPEYMFLEKYLDAKSKIEEALKDPAKTLERIKEISPSEYIYEQTFFTNRAKGDESHLLNWYEPVSEANLRRIVNQVNKELLTPFNLVAKKGGIELDSYRTPGERVFVDIPTGMGAYSFACSMAAAIARGKGYESKNLERLGSELLARADIDGVKYPANSYGRKTPQDGNKVGWNYVSFRDDNIRVDKKWKDGELQYDSGKMMVAYRQGVERLFMREFDVIQDKAKSLVDEMMEGFLLGPAYDAAVSYVNENEAFNRRSAIPNWLINERVELAHDPKGFRVKLDSGFTFFIRKGGFGGDNLYKMGKAVEDKDVNGLHAEVQIEFADGKAKMPYDFKAKVEADEARVLSERNAVKEENDKVRKELSEKGVSDTMLKKLEKVGAFKKSDAKFDVSYTVADFFPDSKTLAEIYPDTYQNTYIYIRGSEAAKSLVGEKGKPIPEPLFAKGQFASLDTQGNIIVDMSTPEKRVRVGEDKFENAVLRDITACVVKKIRREEGLNDDTARSAEYLADILGVKGRDKKTGASTKFTIYEDKTLTDILHQAIRRRFTKREKVGFEVSEETIKRVTEKCSEELNKILNDCFSDFVSEREAIMFANRFGMSNSELSSSFGEAQKQAHDGAIISPFDKRFTTRQKSDTYAQYYRQVLRKIDEMVSVGAKDHKSRSLVNEFDELLNEFLRYEYRKNASSRGGEIFSVSPELKLILNLDGSGMKMADKTGSQKVGDGKFERVVVDNAVSPAEQVARAEEVATLNKQKTVEKVEDTVDANGITASQKKAIADLESKLNALFKQFASGKKVADTQKKLVALMPELTKLIKDLNPNISDAKVASLMKEAQTYFAFRVQGSPFMRDKKDGGGKEETPFGSVVTDGRMSVRGVDYEQGLIASYAAKIAWEKARHRGSEISDIADGITSSIEAELRAMGVPAADAKTVSMSISADAKVVAENIIKDVDATVTEAQIISAAKSKAARHAIGNKIYRSFRRGYKVGSDGVEAHDRAERIVERQRMRAMRRAVGYTLGELNSALGINLIGDITNIGRDGFKYGTAKDLAIDFTKRVVDAFRSDNYDMRNATDGEIMADPVFRAEYAATVSSWLVEAAKALSYGRERELAIRDAMRIRVTMPPTLRDLQRTIEHHAEMLGKDLGKMSVEKTLDEIDKLIDNRPKFKADGEVEAGASGASRVSEATRVYRRGIEPRLQEYWKFVKEAMRFNGEKVASEIERISTLLEASETELTTIKNTAPSELKAEKLEDRDVLKMKLSALMRYGGLVEKSAGEVLDVYQNDISRDIAFAAERFLLERKRREEENRSIADDFINDIDTLLKDKKGYEDLSKIGKASRRYFMWNIPDMFLKYNAHFKSDSKSSAHLTRLRQAISLAHEEHMRLSSIRQGEMLKAVEEVYGMPFADFVQMACVPDPKFSRFSRSSWVIPEKDGPTVEHWTGKYYQHDMPSIGKKKGDRIMETLHLAVPKGDPRHGDKTKFDTPLSLANLIYIYAACRQRDMEKNCIIFGRDAAYMKDLENTIGVRGVMIADRIVSIYDKMREDISPVSEYITGMPVRSPDNFFIPLVFAHDKSADRITRYSVNPIPKFLTARKFHDGVSLKEDTNIFELTTRRIQDAYHYKAFGILADNTKEQLANSKVVSMYHKLLGDSSAKSLYDQLNETFNGGTAIDHQGGVGIRNFITATALGFSPTSSLKQLEGIGGWGLGMKPTEWVKMVLWDKWFNPEVRSAVDMLHQTGFFETKKGIFGGDISQRAEGFSEPMLLLMNARESGGTAKAMSAYTKAKEWYKGHMLDFMRFFDRISTDFGAGTYYVSRKNFYKNAQRMTEADAHRAALADTDYMIQIGQASGRPEFMHNWQRGGTSGKFLTHFVGPTLVRAGVEIEMLHRHFMVDRSRKSFNALASKLFAAHVICPAILTGVTQLANYFFGERDDKNAKIWDDFAENYAVSMLLGPLSGVLIIGQIAEGGMRKVANRDSTNKGWRRRYEIPLTSKLNALSDSLINIGNDTIGIVDSVLDGAEITPAMVKSIREDTATLLKQVFPMMRFINLGTNLYNDFSEEPPKSWASPE